MGLWDIVGTVGSAAVSGYFNKKATDAQTSAANQANQLTTQQWQQSRLDYAPWLGVGKNALYSLSALTGIMSPDLTRRENERVYETAMNNFQASPSYNFRMSEGLNALDRSAASRGRLRSGAQDKAVLEYGQGLASQEFDNYYRRIASLAGVGQQTATQNAVVGQNAVNNISNNLLNKGNARASGYGNTAGIINQGIQNLLV